jgi:hypothetical protein
MRGGIGGGSRGRPRRCVSARMHRGAAEDEMGLKRLLRVSFRGPDVSAFAVALALLRTVWA